MTRPQIIRADTIDLQDQSSPSAQDHSRKPHPSGLGPSLASHQASELRHVQEERHSEEENLTHAWNQAHGLSEEPPSDDERDFADGMHDDSVGHNGAQSGHGEEQDMADAESGDDMDDDMMDKISSSPSICDGGLFSYQRWPKRVSSINSPTPPPVSTLSRAGSQEPEDRESDGSSPFLQTPAHLPLSLPYSTPSPSSPIVASYNLQSRPSTPISSPMEPETDSSSPFTSSPAHFPLNFLRQQSEVQSEVHHRSVGYHGFSRHEDEGFVESEDFEDERRDTLGPLRKPQFLSVPDSRGQDHLMYQQPQLVKSASDIALDRELLPVHDPLLDDSFDASCTSPLAAAFPEDFDDDDQWETESENCSNDSFESVDFNEDDDAEGLSFPTDSRFVDSGWGGECLRETEDIDFEFVYALHTFVATVEGQANAQKGDTMVLLDDSNSYWWLVRVVKDSTIGYLPAEHIETPTERLARLNKHRNVDLSQTMLGDTTEKSKNPLKKAMRRRNAKQVTFSGNTYVEPSDYEFSSDEEEDGDSNLNGEGQSEEATGNNAEDRDQDEITSVAPLSVKQAKRNTSPEKGQVADEADERRKGGEDERTSDEILNGQFAAANKSRNGTVRNTDSFFRDESIETRKITLTPNILRDDSGAAINRPLEKERVSFELLQPDSKDKIKDDKKKKEKKPGMLSGLFKRKEKKKDGDSPRQGKGSGETSRESPSMEMDDSSPTEKQMLLGGDPLQRSGSGGKLQKSPPSPLSPTDIRPGGDSNPGLKKQPSSDTMSAGQSNSAPRDVSSDKPAPLRVQTTEQNNGNSMLSDLSSKLLSPSRDSGGSVKREKVKRAKQREALDIDSSPDEETGKDPFADSFEAGSQQRGPSKLDELATSSTDRLSESPVHITSADANHDSNDSDPPALVGDSSSNTSADELASLRSSPSPPVTSATITDFSADPNHFHAEQEPGLSPSLSESPSPNSPIPTTMSFSRPQLQPSQHPAPTAAPPPPPTRSPPPQPGMAPIPPPISTDAVARNNSTSTNSTSPGTMPISPPWSDANLRAYLEDPSDIRDLLLLVNDTSGVVPVGPEHPLMRDLYAEEKGKVVEMNFMLDGLLGGWLNKKKEKSAKKLGQSQGSIRR